MADAARCHSHFEFIILDDTQELVVQLVDSTFEHLLDVVNSGYWLPIAEGPFMKELYASSVFEVIKKYESREQFLERFKSDFAEEFI